MKNPILLRPWTDDDRDPFAAMNADTEVMRCFQKPLTKTESDQFLVRIRTIFDEQGWGLWAVEVDGAFAGLTGLARRTAGGWRGVPGGNRFPVENMRAYRAVWREQGMKKIVFRTCAEAESLHQTARPGIGGGCEGDQFAQLQLLECKCLRGGCGGVGDAAAPVLAPEAPANLDTGGEMRGK